MQPHILLIGADWQPRALLRAQLIEDGYEVTAVGSWDEAELLLRTRAVTPHAIVFDLGGELQPEAALDTLARLARGAPVLVLTSAAALSASAVRDRGFAHVMARPFRIQDVVKAVRDLASGGE